MKIACHIVSDPGLGRPYSCFFYILGVIIVTALYMFVSIRSVKENYEM
jgi:type IV secretory pathway TrbL component